MALQQTDRTQQWDAKEAAQFIVPDGMPSNIDFIVATWRSLVATLYGFLVENILSEPCSFLGFTGEG